MASGFQTQLYMKEKTHYMETQWMQEVAVMLGFGICLSWLEIHPACLFRHLVFCAEGGWGGH